MTGRLPEDDAEIESVLLDRPLVSVTDVAYTYGRLDSLATAERFRGIEFGVPEPVPQWIKPDISDEHLLAMTPDAKVRLFDEGDAVIELNVVLSPDPGTPPRLHDEPTTIGRIDWAGMIQRGYVFREKRGLVYDHSLSIHVNGKSADEIDRYVESRFKTWPRNGLADEELMARDDAWIIEELAACADDAALLSDAVDTVAGRIDGLDGGSWEGILSLNLWFDIGTGTSELSGPFAPGIVPVCNEVAIANLRDQFASFSSADNPVAEGVDTVTGEETMVLGTSPGRPLSYYHAKQQGPYDGFDADRSIQNQTLSMTTALAVSAGSSIMDSCRERIGGRSGSVRDFDVHYLPYIPLMNADDARSVYAMVSRAHRDGEPIATELAETIDTWAAPENLRFHQVLINTGVEQNKWKVIAENLGASLMPVTTLARANIEAVNDCPIDLDRYDWLDMFDVEHSQVVPILTGEYLAETMYDPDRYSQSFTTDANDPRVRMFASIVTGEPVSGDLLLEQYVERLVQDQRDLLDDSSRQGHIPYATIAKQYVQTSALERAGLIRGTPPYPVQITMTDINNDSDNETERNSTATANSRDERLDNYLRDHELLAEDGDTPTRASFLLGSLVGRVSALQQFEGVQSPLSRRYTIDSLNRSNFRAVFADATAKNEEYAFASNNGRPINQRFVRLLRDLLVDSDPRDWTTTEDAIQAAYACGLSYARDDVWIDPDDQEVEGEQTDATPIEQTDLMED